jgi:hypothetical protein
MRYLLFFLLFLGFVLVVNASPIVKERQNSEQLQQLLELLLELLAELSEQEGGSS